MEIQWFPGHMAKAGKMVSENLKLVDVVLELADARIPESSRNPMINRILGQKPRILILNKADLADPEYNKAWVKYYNNLGIPAVPVNSVHGEGSNRIIGIARSLLADKMAAMAQKGMRPRPIRAMIVGIPNVGKSSLINKLAGQGKTKTENRPGVTRGQQWIRINKDFELLDTPGILWPKFEDPQVGFKLAATGSIKDEVFDIEEIALKVLEFLITEDPEGVKKRYKLESLAGSIDEVLADIGIKRGLLLPGGAPDRLKSAQILLSEFRTGKIGRYSLESPDKIL